MNHDSPDQDFSGLFVERMVTQFGAGELRRRFGWRVAACSPVGGPPAPGGRIRFSE
ncbi:hypothetical protein ACCUM_2667 [Candidatus Accumulibacter phosphatis]|uniref:Uncharacterized protein n=1 Tax=Candidatus Accumulibacter phosphatis TaxID=327160 RepID=A0A5S4EQR8_9PROT|nr:hypothetical protein ACCUM_2667 [Candidatus Accumulibacter phosphatis]